MAQIKATSEFTQWLDRLKDVQGRARIQARIQRLAEGNGFYPVSMDGLKTAENF